MEENSTPTVQHYRHEARKSISKASAMLSGRKGLSVEEQTDCVNQAKRALNSALDVLNSTLELIQTRDNDAWMKAKAERKNQSPSDDEDPEEDSDDNDDDA